MNRSIIADMNYNSRTTPRRVEKRQEIYGNSKYNMGSRVPTKQKAQNLTHLAKSFQKECGRPEEMDDNQELELQDDQSQKQLKWTTKMKVTLIQIDKKERAKEDAS